MNAAGVSPALGTVPTAAQAHGRRRLLALLIILLALPFAVGAGLYFAGWRPKHTVNHGTLLNPPQPLQVSEWHAAPGEAPPAERIAGYWTLLLAVPGACPADCLARLDELRRIHVSLNKDMVRVRRVALSSTGLPPELLDFRRQQPDLIVAEVPTQSPADGLPPGVHIVDPQGRRVLTFTVDAPARAIRTDLDRLLKFAWNG